MFVLGGAAASLVLFWVVETGGGAFVSLRTEVATVAGSVVGAVTARLVVDGFALSVAAGAVTTCCASPRCMARNARPRAITGPKMIAISGHLYMRFFGGAGA